MFGTIKSRLALRSALGELKSPEQRDNALRIIAEQSAREYAANPDKTESWRLPVMQATETLAEVDADESQALRAAIAAMPGETFWRHELLKRIMRQPQINVADFVYLEDEVRTTPRNFSIWKRLLEESKRSADMERFAHARELFVLQIAEFFPAKGENTWYDVETETQVRSLFFNYLDDAIDHVLTSKRLDDSARQLLELALQRFPSRPDVFYGLATMYARQNNRSAQALEVILQGLMFNPRDAELKICAAKLLMERPGHESEGFALLRQIFDEDPQHREAHELLSRHYLQNGGLDIESADIIRKWIALNPGDAPASAALADYHADLQDKSPQAIEAYEAAIELNPASARYVRQLAIIRHGQKNWAESARLHERLQELGESSKDAVVALATAFAEMNRIDSRAAEIYRQAYDAGLTNDYVLSTYCKSLYHANPSDIDALEVFHKVYRNNPRCIWAALGVANKEMASGHYEEAMEKLAQLLVADNQMEEAMEMAARIVAANPDRKLNRQLLKLDAKVAIKILDRAAQRHPDSMLILVKLVQFRLSQKLRDAETEKLLATICERDPDDLDMQMARADLLFETGRLNLAVKVYKELILKSRTTTAANSGTRVGHDERSRMLSRVMEYLMRSPLKEREDLTFVIEAGLDPAASPETVLLVTRKVIGSNLEHPLDLPLYEKALAIQPDDEELELADARARARRGNARELINLAISRIEALRYEPEVIALLAEAVKSARTPNITHDIETRIIRLFETRRILPDQIACHLAQLLIIQGGYRNEFRPVFRRVAALPRPNPEFLDALQKCREGT